MTVLLAAMFFVGILGVCVALIAWDRHTTGRGRSEARPAAPAFTTEERR